jgi:SAM-dependent methyltransferase
VVIAQEPFHAEIFMKDPTVLVTSEPSDSKRDEFWKPYLAAVHARSDPWLDYSNHRVQLQSLAAALDAAGGVLGRTCLDAGCGRGQLSLALQALGAAGVTGVDVAAATIQELQAKHPTLQWRLGNISDTPTYAQLGQFDLVFALEVLQFVAIDSCLDLLWRSTRPGGRLIALVPNRDCPIVSKTVQRFSARYASVSPNELKVKLSSLADVDFWACRGFWFRNDQRIAPYDLSAWTVDPTWERPPNRLLFIAQRAKEAPQ